MEPMTLYGLALGPFAEFGLCAARWSAVWYWR
jgi:hypothetical protein